MRSSQAAIDMIVMFEVSSEARYNATYRIPTWPGGASGVTIGIGYDCGYQSAAQIASDWGQYLTPDMISKLCACAGMTGARAQVEIYKLRNVVSVSWTTAMAVFQNHDIPKWESLVEKSLPNCNLLSGDSLGALISLAYNRGASFLAEGDRYREMRDIRQHMEAKNFTAIPNDIRSMQRLWPNVPGLQSRRRLEATLFEKGLREPTARAVPAPVSMAPSPIPTPEIAPLPMALSHPKFSVAWTQASLNVLGSETQIAVDGHYGPATISAVKQFQAANSLHVDGIAGPETLKTIAKRLDT